MIITFKYFLLKINLVKLKLGYKLGGDQGVTGVLSIA